MASAFNRRLSDFKNRFSNLLGAKSQGYEEVSAVEQPLMAGGDEDEYQREHGVAGPGGAYRPPTTTTAALPGGTPGGAAGSFTTAMPSQVDELQEVAVLAKDAAEILWEMVLMGEPGADVADMRAKAGQLQSQLRGLIGDYSGSNEALLAQALEAFEMLTRCLDEQAEGGAARAEPGPDASLSAEPRVAAATPPAAADPLSGQSPAAPTTTTAHPSAAAAAAPPPVTAAEAAAPAGDDLISFD